MNGQLTFYRKLQLKNDPFNAAKSEHCSWILGVISPELFPVIPVSSADVSSHLSYVELLVVSHIRRSSWEINEELTVLQKLKRLMTLKGATKHICGGKRGNSSSCLSRIPCRWGSHVSPNTNLAPLPTVEMILLGFQHLTSLWPLPQHSEQRHINWDRWKLMLSAVSNLFVSRLGRRWSTGVRWWWKDSLRRNIQKALIT